MKRFFLKKTLALIIITLVTISSCSKDDDSTSGSFGDAPSGEIVPVEERAFVLTGFDETSSKSLNKSDESQKWWLHLESVVSFSGDCGGEEDISIEEQDAYVAFYPDGSIYAKAGEDGSPINSYESWSWVDSSTKDKIIFQGIEFTFTELWEERLVIASKQSQGSCSAVTYEEFAD